MAYTRYRFFNEFAKIFATNDKCAIGPTISAAEYKKITPPTYGEEYKCFRGCCGTYYDNKGYLYGTHHYIHRNGTHIYRTYARGKITQIRLVNDSSNEEYVEKYVEERLINQTGIRNEKVIWVVQYWPQTEEDNEYIIQSLAVYDDNQTVIGKYISNTNIEYFECYNININEISKTIIDICHNICLENNGNVNRYNITGQIAKDKLTSESRWIIVKFILELNPPIKITISWKGDFVKMAK